MARREDPYEAYAEVRRASPLVKASDTPLTWGVTRHADVSALLRDRRLGHRMPLSYFQFVQGDGAGAEFNYNSLLNHDPPDHTRLRTLMGKAFSASLVRRMRGHIEDLLDGLLTPLLDGEAFDFVSQVALPLPSLVICEILGIPASDRDVVHRNTTGLLSLDWTERDRATSWCRAYMSGVLDERTADPEGDLFQRMLAAEEGDDALTHEEIVDNAILLFVAGFETTRSLVANGVVALFEFPEQQARLWCDPSLSASSVEEFLRFDPPIPFVQRITTEPMEVCGRMLKKDRVVTLMLASANHDETAFEDPELLDITRSPNPHVAFGGGIHHCLGAQLARVEGDVVFYRLASELRTFEAAGDAVRTHPGAGLRGWASVPVRARAL